jgi:surface antigen
MSFPLGSGFNKSGNKDDITASFANDPYAASPVAQLSESDLAYARAAATEVLSRGGADASAPWENPDTGARGTVTPVKSSYTQDGQTCRDFLASYIRGDSQSWLQGEACRMAGQWQIKSLKPLQRT